MTYCKYCTVFKAYVTNNGRSGPSFINLKQQYHSMDKIYILTNTKIL